MQSLLQNLYRPNTLYYGERALAFAAPKMWNSIPEQIKSASSPSTFKTALKTYFFRRHLLDDQCSLIVLIFIVVVIAIIVIVYC